LAPLARHPEHRDEDEQVELVRSVVRLPVRHRRNQKGVVHLVC
jgi:hypothetical protein